MSTGQPAPRRTRRRNHNRGKAIVAGLLVVALIGAILARLNTPLESDSPTVANDGGVSDVIDTVESGVNDVVDEASEIAADGVSAVDNAVGVAADSASDVLDGALTEDASAVQVSIREPIVNNAVVGYDGEGNELLTVSGDGDERCQLIRFILDGNEVGTTAPDSDGSWALTFDNTLAVGDYTSEVECETESGIYTTAPRVFSLPGPPAQADVDVDTAETVDVIEPQGTQTDEDVDTADDTVGSDPATNPDDNQAEADLDNGNNAESDSEDSAESGTAQVDSSVAQPTFFIAQELDKYVGGPISLRGDAEPNTVVEIVFESSETRIVDTARTDDKGDWRYRGSLFEPGNYTITAQLPGTSAEPSQRVTVPSGIQFGSKGSCSGKTPPFGTISGDTYVVNFCEYFSLIADRLGVSFGDLQAANPQIANLDYISQGDIINIPPTP